MDNVDNTLARKIRTTDQVLSRLTLGEIGNRVSAIQIDTSKNGAVKKEILQPLDGGMSRPHTAFSRLPSTNDGFKEEESNHRPHETLHLKAKRTSRIDPVIVEMVPGQNLLPSTTRINDGDMALYDMTNQKNRAASMDVSDDGTAAFLKEQWEVVEDIDSVDKDNPQLVSIYVNPIYKYMRHMEEKFSIRPNMLEGTDITGKMRAILVDWLCQVHNRFHLLQETLYLTVAVIDRYLQVKPCTKNRLQLVGVTAMLVASKYEEMYVPEVADFVYITDNAYTKKDIHEMEQDILRTLDFSFGRPICLNFLRRNSKAGQVDSTKHTLAKYLMELAIIEYDMAHLKPSHIAAAALYLSMLVLDGSHWTKTLQYHSSYSEDDLIPLAKRLAKLVVKSETSKMQAVRKKYSSSKFMKIASIPQLKSEVVLAMASSEANPVS